MKFNNFLNEDNDSKNPKYLFQGIDTSLVLLFANGKLNANEYAKYEMQNRGFDKKGNWIGFEEAEKLWKAKVK